MLRCGENDNNNKRVSIVEICNKNFEGNLLKKAGKEILIIIINKNSEIFGFVSTIKYPD